MQTISLTTGEHTTKFFLIGSGEIETRKISTCINITSAHTKQIITTGNYLINTLVRVNVFMLLVDIGYFYSFSYFKFPLIYGFQSHNQTEKCSFSCTIRTDYADNAIRGKHKIQIVKQQFITVCFSHMFSFDNSIT